MNINKTKRSGFLVLPILLKTTSHTITYISYLYLFYYILLFFTIGGLKNGKNQ